MHPIRSLGKEIHLKRTRKKDKTGMNFEEKNCASHAFNHGHRGINVLKGKTQYIEVFSDNDGYEGGMEEVGHNSYQEEAYKTSVEE